ncbi:MAG: hypothetical protein LBR17_02280 [Bacteroidales bacterium]|nr:hypothetical protein [Bacteroidales bacterium]
MLLTSVRLQDDGVLIFLISLEGEKRGIGGVEVAKFQTPNFAIFALNKAIFVLKWQIKNKLLLIMLFF